MTGIHQLTAPALRYFLEVVRCGSINRASMHLNVASSAISRQISSLEEHLGTPLFERKPKGMTLSASGELLAGYARKVFLDTDRILDEINALEGLKRGSVAIATTEGFAMEFLPTCVADFRNKFDGIQFDIDVYSPNEVSTAIRNGDADIGLTFSFTPIQDIEVVYRQPSPIVAIVRPEHPIANKEKVKLAQLVAYPLALPRSNTTVRQLFDICTSKQQLHYDAALTSGYLSALNMFTMFSDGVSFSGEISVRGLIKSGKVKAIDITDQGMNIRNVEVQVLTGRTLPRVVSSFLDFLIRQMPQAPI